MLSTNLQALKEKARRFFLPAEAVHIFQMIMTSSLFLAVLPTTAMAGPDEMFGKLIGLGNWTACACI